MNVNYEVPPPLFQSWLQECFRAPIPREEKEKVELEHDLVRALVDYQILTVIE